MPELALCGALTLGLPGAGWAGALEAPSPPPPPLSDVRGLISPRPSVTPPALSLFLSVSHQLPLLPPYLLLITSSVSPHPSSARPDGTAWWQELRHGGTDLLGSPGWAHESSQAQAHAGCTMHTYVHVHTPQDSSHEQNRPQICFYDSHTSPRLCSSRGPSPILPPARRHGRRQMYVEPSHTLAHADADCRIYTPTCVCAQARPTRWREEQIHSPCTSSSLVPAPIFCALNDRGSPGGTQSSRYSFCKCPGAAPANRGMDS